MARPIRIEFPGAYYHVVARGNERKEVFRTDADRELFLKTLAQMLQQFGTVLHCYCLMPNHYHLILQTPRGNLSRAMAWLQTSYTIRYNRKHKRYGHLFQGRYKAHLIEADSYARHLINYIHLNPVRPRDRNVPIPPERLETLNTYCWSSHREYAGRRKTRWLNLDWLSYWAPRPRQAHRFYQREIHEWFGRTMPNPWAQLRGGLVLGGEKLWDRVTDLIGDKKGSDEIKWKRHHDQEEVQEILKKIATKQKDERLLMWIQVRLGGQRRVDVARKFGYKDGSAVTHIINRLEKKAELD